MGQISLGIPQSGQTFATEGAKVASDMTTLQAVINGNIDSTNINASAAITRSQLAGGFGNLVATSVGVNTSVVDGKFYIVTAGSTTMTLPTPTANVTIGVIANSGQTGAAPTTIARSSGVINGQGVAGTTSIALGTVGAYVVLLADGSNWNIVAGQQDTGWLALTLSSCSATGAPWYQPQARTIGDRVYMRGEVSASANSFSVTLPIACRPASQVAIFAQNTSVNGVVSTTCQTNGVVAIVATSGQGYSFDPVTFALS